MNFQTTYTYLFLVKKNIAKSTFQLEFIRPFYSISTIMPNIQFANPLPQIVSQKTIPKQRDLPSVGKLSPQYLNCFKNSGS